MMELFSRAGEYAMTVTVREAGEEHLAKAFIETCGLRSPEHEGRPTPMGIVDDRRYLIIAERGAFGPTGPVEICCGDKIYELLRRELLGNGSHWEGLMRLKGGAEDAG